MKIKKIAAFILFLLSVLLSAQENKTVVTQVNENGVTFTIPTVLDSKDIVAIKEASGNLSQIAEIKNLCGDELNIYSGNDDQITPILSVGGIGVISVLSNIAPEYTHNIVEDFLSGNIEKSIKSQVNAIPIIKALFCEVNPIPVKAALNMLGYKVGVPRLPLVEMTEIGKEKMKKELIEFGLLK